MTPIHPATATPNEFSDQFRRALEARNRRIRPPVRSFADYVAEAAELTQDQRDEVMRRWSP